MKPIIFITIIGMALGVSFSQASAITITESIVSVSTDPIWTDTGIVLNPGNTYVIHDAAGTVSWATWSGRYSGPAGDYVPELAFDEWITNNQHGQLIGYVGPDPYAVGQNNSGLFAIGTETVTLSSISGRLWLGFNDDWTHPDEWTVDNFGTMTVHISDPVTNGAAPVPEPTIMLLLGAGLVGLVGFGRKIKR